MAPKRHPDLKGDTCPKCNGSGTVIAGFFEATCEECNGTGLVNSPNACEKCKGAGKYVAESIATEVTCEACNGSGLKPA